MCSSLSNNALLAFLVLLVATGCGRNDRVKHDGDRIIVDDLGREVRYSESARRIVSLAPSFTEILYALGADSMLVGITSLCNYPVQKSEHVQVVGDMLTPDPERILVLEPDLVLISVEGNTQRTFRTLERMGLRIFVSNPRTLEAVLTSIQQIAALTGRKEAGTRITDSLRNVVQHVRRVRPKHPPRVLMLLSMHPLIAAGEGSFLDELIREAGGSNAVSDAVGSYPTLNREEILLRDPEILILPDDSGEDAASLRRRFPEWRSLGVLRSGGLHFIEADILFRPGPRLFRGLEIIHELCLRATDAERTVRE